MQIGQQPVKEMVMLSFRLVWFGLVIDAFMFAACFDFGANVRTIAWSLICN